MRPLREAWRAFWGRSQTEVEVARMRLEWATLKVEVLADVEKLVNSISGRLSKRLANEKPRKKTEDAPAALPAQSAPAAVSPRLSRQAYKRALRARLRGGGVPGVQAGSNGQPEAIEAEEAP